jgi:hypothetical protein
MSMTGAMSHFLASAALLAGAVFLLSLFILSNGRFIFLCPTLAPVEQWFI